MKYSTFKDGDANDVSLEFVDEHAFVEDAIERKEKARSNELLRQTVGNDCDVDFANEDERKEMYVNAACYHLCLGGIGNLPDGIKDKLEDIVADRGL